LRPEFGSGSGSAEGPADSGQRLGADGRAYNVADAARAEVIGTAVLIGLGRIVALHYCSSTSYQIP
jgi:hypothetical protein